MLDAGMSVAGALCPAGLFATGLRSAVPAILILLQDGLVAPAKLAGARAEVRRFPARAFVQPQLLGGSARRLLGIVNGANSVLLVDAVRWIGGRLHYEGLDPRGAWHRAQLAGPVPSGLAERGAHFVVASL